MAEEAGEVPVDEATEEREPKTAAATTEEATAAPAASSSAPAASSSGAVAAPELSRITSTTSSTGDVKLDRQRAYERRNVARRVDIDRRTASAARGRGDARGAARPRSEGRGRGAGGGASAAGRARSLGAAGSREKRKDKSGKVQLEKALEGLEDMGHDYPHGLEELPEEYYPERVPGSAEPAKAPKEKKEKGPASWLLNPSMSAEDAEELARRGQLEARKLVGPDGRVMMSEFRKALQCNSMMLMRSILMHLPYHVLIELSESPYCQQIGAGGTTASYPLFTGNVLGMSMMMADQRERSFWLRCNPPDANPEPAAPEGQDAMAAAASSAASSSTALATPSTAIVPPPPPAPVLIRPRTRRAVSVFKGYGMLLHPEWWHSRFLDEEEQMHPRVRPSQWRSMQKTRQSKGLAIVDRWSRFNQQLTVFCGDGALDGVLSKNVVLAGSAVMASLLHFSSPAEQRLTAVNVLKLKLRYAGVGDDPAVHLRSGRGLAIMNILEYAGLSGVTVHNVLMERYNGRHSPFYWSDLDLFVVASSRAEAAQHMCKAAERIRENMTKAGGGVPATVLTTKNAITICGQWPTRPVQIVFYVCETLDETLSYCDLDCTAIAFDGRDVWAAPRAMRALKTGYNHIPPGMLLQRPDASNRAGKYCRRGFGAMVFEVCKHMPRCDVEIDERTQAKLDELAVFRDVVTNPPREELVSKMVEACNSKGKADDALLAASIAKVMRIMRRSGASLVPRGPGIGGPEVAAYARYVPFLMEAGLLNSAPLELVAGPVTADMLLPNIWWKRSLRKSWMEWGMVPFVGKDQGKKCYQCKKLLPPEPSKEEAALGVRLCHVKINRLAPGEKRTPPICEECKAVNEQKRRAVPVGLAGRVAVVTGGRSKIGYEIAIRFLQAGASVVLTSRFPYLAAEAFAKYATEKGGENFSSICHRVHVFGVDFRHLKSLTDFSDYVARHYSSHLSVLINNAAQTVRRPPAYYAELLTRERLLAQQASMYRKSSTFSAPHLADANVTALQMTGIVNMVKYIDVEPFSSSVSKPSDGLQTFLGIKAPPDLLSLSDGLQLAVVSAAPAEDGAEEEKKDKEDEKEEEKEEEKADDEDEVEEDAEDEQDGDGKGEEAGDGAEAKKEEWKVGRAIMARVRGTLKDHNKRNWRIKKLALEMGEDEGRQRPAKQVADLLRHAQLASEAWSVSATGADSQSDMMLSSVLASLSLLPSDLVAAAKQDELFPKGQKDGHGEPLDLRKETSWNTPIDGVPLLELMEVMVVNSVAPFLLTSKLLPGLKAGAAATIGGSYVVNVTAQEGNFSFLGKNAKHPHTNMGKASLNMLTRTIAADLAEQGVYVTAADTGWVSQMQPQGNMLPPLNIEDGAARVVDPVVGGQLALSEGRQPLYGVLLQHFCVADW
mmetsp:Transcript_52796/g.123484  ORF Transcript_52796/g.123484 Transcript_52796/m.123484 type:complete len:1401 (-) Transcript_52796:51-4253(-)